jgi:hypothetical protein
VSHFITVPTNENGIFFDPALTSVVNDAVADQPFGFEDFFIYSHGWSTDADQSMTTYSRFSVELARQILLLGAQPANKFPNPPRESLGVGIHWPSEITEDPGSPLNLAQLFTFYTMEQRADQVGRNATYTVLRSILNARAADSALAMRIVLLGHSFGCKVICAALQDLQTDIANGTIAVPPNTTFRVVLLEPATDCDNLEPGDIYGNVVDIEGLRLLITTSQLDKALVTWFLEAGRTVNLFHPQPALGAVGPTDPTKTAFVTWASVAVTTGFSPNQISGHNEALIVADLTPVHTDHTKANPPFNGGFAGSHADIFFPEMYNLIAGFVFS